MPKLRLTSLIAAIGLIGLSAVAYPSPVVSGPVTELWANDGSNAPIIWIRIGTTFTSTCGATSGYMVMDLTQPGMKEAYALALAAFMSGRDVKIAGGGTCLGLYEKLKFIYVIG